MNIIGHKHFAEVKGELTSEVQLFKIINFYNWKKLIRVLDEPYPKKEKYA